MLIYEGKDIQAEDYAHSLGIKDQSEVLYIGGGKSSNRMTPCVWLRSSNVERHDYCGIST